jgi:hypothetical protein
VPLWWNREKKTHTLGRASEFHHMSITNHTPLVSPSQLMIPGQERHRIRFVIQQSRDESEQRDHLSGTFARAHYQYESRPWYQVFVICKQIWWIQIDKLAPEVSADDVSKSERFDQRWLVDSETEGYEWSISDWVSPANRINREVTSGNDPPSFCYSARITRLMPASAARDSGCPNDGVTDTIA